ncbi:MAG: hypothetical protein JSV25_15330 [Spirochaetota bacterium]|nr:MAG: hypothetical protein JSV25_15330 [Spirochaetota bacterium]
MKRICWFLFMFVICSTILTASPLDRGVDLYKQRKLEEAITYLNEIKAIVSPQEKKHVYILIARCYWTKATYYTQDNKNKAEVFAKGLQAIKEAQEILGEDARFYYWEAVLVGEKANAFFSIDSFTAADTIKELCNRVIALDPSYDDGGAYLILGRMYYMLPKLFGGNNEESIHYLLKAKKYMDMRPNDERKHFVYKFLAESYVAQREWRKAKQALFDGLNCPKDQDAPHEESPSYLEMEKLLNKINQTLKD